MPYLEINRFLGLKMAIPLTTNTVVAGSVNGIEAKMKVVDDNTIEIRGALYKHTEGEVRFDNQSAFSIFGITILPLRREVHYLPKGMENKLGTEEGTKEILKRL